MRRRTWANTISNTNGSATGLPRLLRLLILLVAFALRTWELDGRALWFDEGMEYWVATAAPTEIFASVQRGIQDPPLYSVLLHWWMQLGHGEFQLRYLSVLASVLSVAGVILLGHRFGGSVAGLYTGALFAVLPGEIRYAQEVGQYGLMICLLTWTTVAFFAAIRQNWTRAWILWLLLATGATYSYYGAVFTVLTPFALYLAGEIIQRRWRRAMALVAMVFSYTLFVLPLVLFFLPQQLFRGPTAQALQSRFASPLAEVRTFLGETQGLLAFQFTGWPWTGLPAWLPALPISLVLAAAALSAMRSPGARQSLLVLVATTGIYYTASRWNLFPYGFRYGLILTPLLLPVMGVGLATTASFKSRWTPAAWGAMLLFLCLVGIALLSLPHPSVRERLLSPATPHAWPEQEELRPVTSYWLDQRAPGEITYVYYGAAPAFRYYLRLLGVDLAPVPATWYLDCWRSATPAYCQVENIYFGRGLRSLAAAEKGHTVVEALPLAFDSGWFVFSHVFADEQELILKTLSQDYEVVEQVETTGAALYRLRRQ
ncbi:MAG: hypothetical protein DCC55_13165 [Chloroflexi bacterium]|nr:MAG: hypothetical protein DCC55_13165 [Chloroflexota bacterium]